jgi:hypothetical protein
MATTAARTPRCASRLTGRPDASLCERQLCAGAGAVQGRRRGSEGSSRSWTAAASVGCGMAAIDVVRRVERRAVILWA